jgi:hypothetical protein
VGRVANAKQICAIMIGMNNACGGTHAGRIHMDPLSSENTQYYSVNPKKTPEATDHVTA